VTTAFPHRHLLGIEGLSREDLVTLLDLSDRFFEISERPIKKVPVLRGKTVVNLFFEASTRTRTSFEIAGKRLSADVVNVSSSGSSTSKGTLLDTARNLYHAARRGGAPSLGRRAPTSCGADCSIVNAGAASTARPRRCSTAPPSGHAGRIGGSPWRSQRCLALSGGAPTTSRSAAQRDGAAAGADAVPARIGWAAFDRTAIGRRRRDIQLERMGAGFFSNPREYSRFFGLGRRRLALTKPDAIVMHPGPVNRGLELDPDVADGERSVILDQVTRGVAVRMAILYLLGGGTAEDAPSA
jgi:aspartate carbamoyltransferase catalytic subunit